MSAYEVLAASYDALTADVGYERRADYLEKLFRRSRIPVHTVLDLACGTGEMTAILTERGYELIGADLYGTVDAAICCLDSLNYLTNPKDVQKTFQRLRLFIAPGGLLAFDVNSVEKLSALGGQVFLDERPDIYCVWRTEYEKRSRICSYWMDIFTRRPDGGWSRGGEEHRQRAYTVEELRAWLMDAGFTRVRTFGDCRMSAPREGEQRIYFSAIRGK